MLKPAILYKEELNNKMSEYFYTPDMFYYCGYPENTLISFNRYYENDINDNDETNIPYQWVIINSKNDLLGYISYTFDTYLNMAYAFGIFSFDRGNPIVGRELYKCIMTLLNRLHKIEFCAMSGNPATKGYDRLLNKCKELGYITEKLISRDTTKDFEGKYHDRYSYGIINPNN